MKISLIVAASQDSVIGVKNRIPWRLPTDLARFRLLTTGHVVLVGRKTFESIGWELPKRRMVVLSHRTQGWLGSNVRVAHSVEEALRFAAGEAELFVAGGAKVYKQFLPLADKIYMTRVETRMRRGQAKFPRFNKAHWDLTFCEPHPADEKNEFPYTFLVFERKKPRAQQ